MQDTITIARTGCDEPPLVVDLDGTLLKSDLLIEGFFALVAADPMAALGAVAALARGRAALKARVASDAAIDLHHLPWNAELIRLLAAERARGRRIYLASASDRRWAEAAAEHLGLFDGVFASDGRTNLKGRTKAAVLCQAFGAGGFDYIGNEAADLAIWEQAAGVLVVNAAPGLIRRARARWPDAVVIGRSAPSLRDYVRTLRLHQWLKNLLLFVPALAAHDFAAPVLAACLVACLSFSLCASSVYVLNDLIDLGRDRAHPTKRNRPLARGAMPVFRGIALVPVLLSAAILLALALPPAFVAVLAGYYLLTLAYSLYLKRQMMVDVVVLACLYGLRLVAGGVAVSVPLSAWLAAFSIFLFCSLALVKRCTELVGRIAKGAGDPAGRAYQLNDLPILEALAASSGFTAVLVLALYLHSGAVQALYHAHERLWLLCVLLIFWLGRVLILTHRGEMHDDPVVFAATDRTSQVCLVMGLAILLASQ